MAQRNRINGDREPTTIGERLAEARREVGLSQERLAELATEWLQRHNVGYDRISQDTISAVERGEISSPSAAAALALVRVLGVRLEWLIVGESPMKQRRKQK